MRLGCQILLKSPPLKLADWIRPCFWIDMLHAIAKLTVT